MAIELLLCKRGKRTKGHRNTGPERAPAAILLPCRLRHLRCSCFALFSLCTRTHPQLSEVRSKCAIPGAASLGTRSREGRDGGRRAGSEEGMSGRALPPTCLWHRGNAASLATQQPQPSCSPAAAAPWMLVVTPRNNRPWSRQNGSQRRGKSLCEQSLHCPHSRHRQVHTGTVKGKTVKSF